MKGGMFLDIRETYNKYVHQRDKLGITDYEVAKRSGLRRNIFTDWKQEVSQPKIDKLMKIADAIEVDITYFLN